MPTTLFAAYGPDAAVAESLCSTVPRPTAPNAATTIAASGTNRLGKAMMGLLFSGSINGP